MDVNITLVSILVIILLFIPGFFFKRFYYSGQFTKQFGAGIFAERFITSIFWGLIVQSITLVMVGRFTQTNYIDIRDSISRFYSDLNNNKLPDCTAQNFYYGLGYIILAILCASVLGLIFHNVVRVLRIDILFPVLRFTNYWNYYFRGDFKNLRGNRRKGKVISTNLDIIVQDGSGKNRLYSGFLAHYTISHVTGELETIAIANAERWSNTSTSFKSISGDNLVIPYKTVININLRYNIKSRARKQYYEVAIGLFSITLFGAFFFLIPYYYYNSIGLLKTIIALIIAIFDWLFITSILAQPFTQYNRPTNNPNKAGYFITSLVFITVFTYLLYRVLH